MKKFSAVLLTLLMILSISACTQKPDKMQESYPFKNITMIVPMGAGGTTDLVGRQLAAALEKTLNVTITVENKTGSSGAVGCQAALDDKHDGSVLLFSADSLGTQRVMGLSKLSYNDFSPIMVAANDPKVIVVKGDSKYKTVEDLLNDIKSNPNKVQMSYTGPGGSGHVQALILNKFGYYPALTAYSGATGCITAVLNGEVSFFNSNYSTVASYIANGDLRMLAACSTSRMEKYKDIPCLVEVISNSDFYMDIPYCPLSLLVAKDVPQDIQDKLINACKEAVKDETFLTWMNENCIDKLYEKYTNTQEIKDFYYNWESVVSWIIYDANAATYSPADFNIPRV